MIQASTNFYTRLKRGDLPEILALLGSTSGNRWVFGKTPPSVAENISQVWDGSRLYGQGTYGGDIGLVSAGARVLNFGSISHQIASSNKDFMMSLSQSEIGSMQVVFDNADGYFSDLLGGDKATSFLNFSLEITCGFPDLDFEDAILLFSGTITEEHMNNRTLKIVAEGQTSSLLETYTMPRSGRYLNPKNENDILPFIYGNTGENSTQGVSTCPCIDIDNFVHCICAHPLPANASVLVYADNVQVTSGYSVTLNGDYENEGEIAYITFDAEQTGTISCTVSKGKDGLTNPIDIIEDILATMEDSTPQNSNSWSRATNDADALSYTCSGVVNADQPPSFWLTTLLSNFLGSWYLNTSNELVVSLDSSRRNLTPAGYLHEYEANGISGIRTRANLCNQVFVNYAYVLTDIDRRFKNNATPQYLSYSDGESTKDESSQLKYGVVKKSIDLQWTRNTATVTSLQTWMISQYADPVWAITYPEIDVKNLLVEPGDYIAYSWETQQDDEGEPVVNQIARVLKVSRDLDALTVTFDIMDTSEYIAIPPYVWDGSHTYGEAFETYGNNRNRASY